MKNLICITGPTAVGKTALSIRLAQYLDTEIISADSRQFYREMRIGTAVPDDEELRAVPHHFIGHISIHESFDAGAFEIHALTLLEKLFKQYDNLVLVGGSGLYINALLYGLDEFPEIPENIRAALNEELKTRGLNALAEELKRKDPVTYARIDIQNPRRVIRALEVARASGKPYSHFAGGKKKKRDFNFKIFALNLPRPILYRRIELRTDKMMEDGLPGEARSLYPYRHLPALQTVGYRELFDYFDGKWDLDRAVFEIKKNTRRYAKRQLTWWRKNSEVIWCHPEEAFDSILSNYQ